MAEVRQLRRVLYAIGDAAGTVLYPERAEPRKEVPVPAALYLVTP
jgi:hypothetical protein